MTAEIDEYQVAARTVHKAVQNCFAWRPDKALHGVPDHWTEHADAVEAGHGFLGDCDDFAMTCAEVLRRQLGAGHAEAIRIVYCQTETDEYHVICVLDGLWALDNRQRMVQRIMALKGYRLISYLQIDKPGQWFRLKNEG